jgi:hypothetical protein
MTQERLDLIPDPRYTEILVPAEIDQVWLDGFNQKYANIGDRELFTGTVIVESWIIEPERGVGLVLQDGVDVGVETGDTAAKQLEITGLINYAAPIINHGYYDDIRGGEEIQMISFFIASVRLPDGSVLEVANGGIILMRLDKIRKIMVSVGEN